MTTNDLPQRITGATTTPAYVDATSTKALATARLAASRYLRAVRHETFDAELVMNRVVNWADQMCTRFGQEGAPDLSDAYATVTAQLGASRDRLTARRPMRPAAVEPARPFQVGDDIRVTPRSADDVSGLWTIIELREVPDTGNYIAGLTATGGTLHGVVVLTPDRTAAARDAYLIELINDASTGADTYDCPEPGCDYTISAVGTPDPDEPDYFTEDIEQHERGHEPVGALTAPPGVAIAPPPGPTPQAWGAVTARLEEIAAIPAIVQLDRTNAANHLAYAAEHLLERLGDTPVGMAARDLRKALADYREANR